ncbi:MAG: hypothetical protein Q8S84_06805 [bacterium]|nr:hypothetical protein [bacterium]
MKSLCIGEVPIKVCIHLFFESCRESYDELISFSFNLAKLNTLALTILDISLIASVSPTEEAEKPASIISTQKSSNFLAIAIFFSGVIFTHAVCAPSLSVVSNICILFIYL